MAIIMAVAVAVAVGRGGTWRAHEGSVVSFRYALLTAPACAVGCAQHAFVVNPDGSHVSVKEAVNDDEWLLGEFVQAVQTRGAAVIKARKLSSAMSAAKAIGDHMRIWWHGTPEGEFTSMGVMSDGSYGIKEGVMYSHPVTIKVSGESRCLSVVVRRGGDGLLLLLLLF